MKNSESDFQTRSNPSCAATLTITVRGYVPPLKNQLNGCHWKMIENQKRRTSIFLLNALKSGSLSIQHDRLIGTDTTSRLCKIFASRLESYRRTNGTLFLVGVSCPERLRRKQKKEPKLTSQL